MQRKWQGFVSRGCWLHPIFPIGICQTSFLPLRARKHSPGWDAAAAPTAVRVTPGSHLRLDRKPTRASTAHQLVRGTPWAEVWWDNNNGKRKLVLWMALWENWLCYEQWKIPSVALKCDLPTLRESGVWEGPEVQPMLMLNFLHLPVCSQEWPFGKRWSISSLLCGIRVIPMASATSSAVM